MVTWEVVLQKQEVPAFFMCTICGKVYKEDTAVAVLLSIRDVAVDKDGDGGGLLDVRQYPVCSACLDATPEGAAQKAREYAEQLRERAQAVDELSLDLPFVTANHWKSREDLLAFESQQTVDATLENLLGGVNLDDGTL